MATPENDGITALETEQASEVSLAFADDAIAAPGKAPAEETAMCRATPDETGEEEVEITEEPANPAQAIRENKDTPSTLEAIQNDPYDFDRCQVLVSLLFLPRVGQEPRMVVCGIKTHDDDPLIELLPGHEILSSLPGSVQALIEKVRTQMPTRAMERMARKQTPKKSARPAVTSAAPVRAAVPAPVMAPNAPAIAAASQPDLFGLLGGAQ